MLACIDYPADCCLEVVRLFDLLNALIAVNSENFFDTVDDVEHQSSAREASCTLDNTLNAMEQEQRGIVHLDFGETVLFEVFHQRLVHAILLAFDVWTEVRFERQADGSLELGK